MGGEGYDIRLFMSIFSSTSFISTHDTPNLELFPFATFSGHLNLFFIMTNECQHGSPALSVKHDRANSSIRSTCH